MHDVGVRRGAVVERGERLGDDRLEIFGGLDQHAPDSCGIADHGTAVSGAEASRRERRDPPQPFGPVPWIALHLLQIAGVRHGVDDQVARAHHRALRAKDPAMVIGLGAAVMDLEIEAAEPECELAVEQRVRHQLRAPEIVVFPARLRALGATAELAGVDGGVVAAGALVSRETVEHRVLGNDARPRLSRLQESLEPECMVDAAGVPKRRNSSGRAVRSRWRSGPGSNRSSAE
jgi:hypothetical protein